MPVLARSRLCVLSEILLDRRAHGHTIAQFIKTAPTTRHPASALEAKELARHANIRQTAKYTHIGMEDRAEALGNLPSPKLSANADNVHIVCNSGGVLGRELAASVSDADPIASPENEQSPVGAGLRPQSSDVTCRQVAGYCEGEEAGFAPAIRTRVEPITLMEFV